MKITADFTKITGRIKPMNGVGQPPFISAKDERFMHWLREANIPFSRLHDVGGAFGSFRFVDIPNIFRDFDADETDPASYDFVFTDWLISALMKQKCEPFFRLGVTIENGADLRSYRIDPPKDCEKWARICEHIVRHYNEGWADGFTYGIRYFEIWNEPDGRKMWTGTPLDYYRLYDVTARHLKKCFGDTIRVGGYASTGFPAFLADPDCDGLAGREAESFGESLLKFAHGFFRYLNAAEEKIPLDFFSWHAYNTVHEMEARLDYCNRMLEKYGYGDIEVILNEWNTERDPVRRATSAAAAKILATMLSMQKRKMDMLCYYDARIGASPYSGLFDPSAWKPFPAYYAFMSFGELYRLGNEVETESDDRDVYVGGAADGQERVLVLANIATEAREVELDLRGIPTDLRDVRVLRIDDSHTYTPVGRVIRGGKLTMPAMSCAEIVL